MTVRISYNTRPLSVRYAVYSHCTLHQCYWYAQVKSAEQKTHKRNALEVSTQDTTFFMFAGTEKVRELI
jgi:hypothetical protein